MKKYLIALDAGTGSFRAVIFDYNGKQIAVSQQEWNHKENPAFPNSMDFDYKNNWELCKRVIRDAISKASISSDEIAAISSTCMREGIVIYDNSGKEIWSCANVDARSADVTAELVNSNSQLQLDVYHRTGQTYALSAIPRLLWIKENQPEIYAAIAKIGMFNDWLTYKLTKILKIEPSNGSTLGLINLQSRKWDQDIISKFQFNPDWFPDIIEPGQRIGFISQDIADELSLPHDVQIIAGGGDAQLGCLGCGAIEENSAVVLGGSFWQYELNTSQAITDLEAKVRLNCHAVDNLWQYEAIAFQPGLVMRWFRDAFAFLLQDKADKQNCSIYDLLNAEAANIPVGSNGMLATFSDVMNFVSWKHAACGFINFELDPEKFNIYTFYRCLLENAALITYGHIRLLDKLTHKLPDHIIFAGGASKSDLWCQILADVTGVNIKVPVVKEATALGAAILAGYGAGIYSDLKSAVNQVVKYEKSYYPNKENHLFYKALFEKWQSIYANQLALADSGLTNYMWCAPGANNI